MPTAKDLLPLILLLIGKTILFIMVTLFHVRMVKVDFIKQFKINM